MVQCLAYKARYRCKGTVRHQMIVAVAGAVTVDADGRSCQRFEYPVPFGEHYLLTSVVGTGVQRRLRGVFPDGRVCELYDHVEDYPLPTVSSGAELSLGETLPEWPKVAMLQSVQVVCGDVLLELQVTGWSYQDEGCGYRACLGVQTAITIGPAPFSAIVGVLLTLRPQTGPFMFLLLADGRRVPLAKP